MNAQKRLLDQILRVAHGAHHPVGDREQQSSELVVCHVRFTCLVSIDEATKGNVMKVFLAGASGALGKRLIPQLLDHGHSVVGTTRSESKAVQLCDLGAKPVVLDALDRDAVVAAVAAEQPDAIVHQLTALTGVDFRKFEKSFGLTNRLRTEGTDNLLAAAKAAGVERFVAQSYAGWPYERTGGPVKDEDCPLQDPGPRGARATLAAIRYVERATLEFGGVVLRYGGFYGPGTGI